VDYRLPVEPVRQELQRILMETDLWTGKTCVLQLADFTEARDATALHDERKFFVHCIRSAVSPA